MTKSKRFALPAAWTRRLYRMRETARASVAVARLVALIVFELLKPPTPAARRIRRRMRRMAQA